ncbi:hypothetical protein [Paraburkholderia caballeronis]|nr:hypothetical protein [Paraburkholderia caballeronis]
METLTSASGVDGTNSTSEHGGRVWFDREQEKTGREQGKTIVMVTAILVAVAGVVGAKVDASGNPSCETDAMKGATSNPSLTFCTFCRKVASLTPGKSSH